MHIACAVVEGNIDIFHVPADGYGVLLRGCRLQIVIAIHRETAFLHARTAIDAVTRSLFPVIPEAGICHMGVDNRPGLKIQTMTTVIINIAI